MIKFIDKIKNNFNNASNTYDEVAYVQKKAANFLINKLLEIQKTKPETILDLGSGSGYVVEILLKTYHDSFYFLNDIAEKMLDICKMKFDNYANFTFLHDDMANVLINSYDLIVSNFSLQWTNDLYQIIKTCNNMSKTFAFSTLLNGTFKNWQKIINQYEDITINNYPNQKDIVYYCNNIKSDKKFYHWEMDIPIKFDSTLLLMCYMKKLGATSANSTMSYKNFRRLVREHNNPIIVCYKIFFGIFVSNI